MERLHAIFGEDRNAINAFIKSFISSTFELLHFLEDALKKEDKKAAKDFFHRLKGSAGNSGIMQIHALCLEAEEKVLQSDWNEVHSIFSRIEEVMKKIENL